MKHLMMRAFKVSLIMVLNCMAVQTSRAEAVTTVTNHTSPDASALIIKMSQAIEKGDYETAELERLRLCAQGTNALPAIKSALSTANPKVRMSLAGTLSGISGDSAAEALLDLAVNDADADVASVAAGMLEKRPIPRALTSNELDRAITRMQSSNSRKAAQWAALLARSKEAHPSDASARIQAILERYESDIVSIQTNFASHGYLSPQAMRLNAFLIVMPHIEAKHSVPIIKKRFSEVSDVAKRKWLLFARGMCRDQSAADELRQFVLNSEEDVSERALALRAYVMAAGTNAIPLLESFTENTEVGYVPGHPPPDLGTAIATRPLQSVARDELAGLRYPDLRLKYRGY